MNNPFETIEARLGRIEGLLLDLKNLPEKRQSSDQHDQLLTVREVADMLSLSIQTVYLKASLGQIPVYHITPLHFWLQSFSLKLLFDRFYCSAFYL